MTVSCDDWARYCTQEDSGWYLDTPKEVYSTENININLKEIVVFKPSAVYDKQPSLSSKVEFLRDVAYQEFFNDNVRSVDVTHGNQGI